MSYMKKIIPVMLLSLIACTPLMGKQITKSAAEVFHKWFEWQRIVPTTDLTKLEQLSEKNIVTFQLRYEQYAALLKPLQPFLCTISAGRINSNGYDFRPLDVARDGDAACIKNFAILNGLVDNDMSGFVRFITEHHFLCEENVTEEHCALSHDIITKYNALSELLFAQPGDGKNDPQLFTVANRFYEYCFGEKTFPEFNKLLLNPRSYPIARMLYAVAWYNLAGNGWKNWHENSLKNLSTLAGQGHRFVYIAGGSDLYQLIAAGVYNITNIDPQLPSQPKYYTNDWQFIMQGSSPDGGIGDKIIFTLPERTITMIRTSYTEPGTTFKARLAAGDVIEIPHSTTSWTLFDQDGKQLGVYTLERRFCQQSDFDYEPNKTLIMSFNELYYIALPEQFGGWGINSSRFDPRLSIVVKQLEKPVSKQMADNMRLAALLNTSDFHFIALGTCIN